MLWVRSYHFQDACYGNIPGTNFISAGSQLGYLFAIFSDEPKREWTFGTTPLPDETWRKLYRDNEPTKAPNQLLVGVSYSLSRYSTWCMPYWLLMLFSALLATVPWLRYRFRLRTLLIGMTLVAAIFGMIAVAVG